MQNKPAVTEPEAAFDLPPTDSTHVEEPRTTPKSGFVTRSGQISYKLSDEANAALDAAVNNYSHDLEARSRLIANKREMVLAEHVQDAEGELLASGIGTAITLAVAWLRPTAFFFMGLTAPAIKSVFENQPVQPGQFVSGVVGAVVLGATWALDAQSVRIKRWWRQITKRRSAALPE